MKKKVVALVLLLALAVFVMAGCEYKTGNRITGGKDVQTFTYAYIRLGGEEIVNGYITQWRDYDDSDTVQVMIGGKPVTVGGMAKGSGMICPNMATMLSFVTTDCAITRDCLQTMLTETVGDTYNMMSVDGDMSTNDTVLVLANGLAGNKEIVNKNSADYLTLKKALYTVNEMLAKAIVRDGEGATKLIEVDLTGAATETEAKILAKGVVTSNLVKAAFFGEDANWGRVLSSLGSTGIAFDPQQVSVTFKSNGGSVDLFKKGHPVPFDEAKAKKVLEEKEITVLVKMGEGAASAKSWGCDLTYDYVKINGEYRT